MKIIILPMDNRPPNYKFLIELAEIYKLDICLPPKDKLSFYMTPGDIKWLKNWLVEQTGDVFIISTEMLCYGGLIASRENWNNFSEADENLEVIKTIKQANPKSRIFLSSIIRRASISVFSAGSKEIWIKMNQYLKNLRIKEKGVDCKKDSNLQEDYIKQYWDLRERNHKINKRCIEYIKDNIADTLVLAQEDTFEDGPQKEEILEMKKIIKKYNVSDKVYIHNGADEVIQELLIKTFNSGQLDVKYDSEITKNKIMDFEDRAFSKNVESHLKLTGFTKDENSSKSLIIAGTDGEKTASLIENENKTKKEVYLLDVFNANGSNQELLNKINVGEFDKLCGFSAWNTASNSLGTILCEAADKEDKSYIALIKFYIERLVDDHLYQGKYRDVLEKSLLENNEDIYKVKDDSKIYLEFKNEIFTNAANIYLKNAFLNKTIQFENEKFTITSISLGDFFLPWKRTFECSLKINLSYKKIEGVNE